MRQKNDFFIYFKNRLFDVKLFFLQIMLNTHCQDMKYYR